MQVFGVQDPEPDGQLDLVPSYAAFLDAAPYFFDFEPVQVLDGLAGPGYRAIDRLLDSV